MRVPSFAIVRRVLTSLFGVSTVSAADATSKTNFVLALDVKHLEILDRTDRRYEQKVRFVEEPLNT